MAATAMKRVAVTAIVLVFGVLVPAYAWQLASAVAYLSQHSWRAPDAGESVCDGNFPGWMLEAQDYDGSGCAYYLPLHEAPLGADWTIYCTMWCDRTWPPED